MTVEYQPRAKCDEMMVFLYPQCLWDFLDARLKPQLATIAREKQDGEFKLQYIDYLCIASNLRKS